jgi:putrescine importer
MHRNPKGFFNYVIMPLLGAGSIGILWINLNVSSIIMGIAWFAVGFVYLVYLTKAFRAAPPQFVSEEAEI